MLLNSLDIPKKPYNTKVVIAMSGGVDSSVAAALLVNEGYNVIGITLQLYNNDNVNISNIKSCCSSKDNNDARKVANILGIPHYILNYENLFKKLVIDKFIDSYMRGETPVPCILCNQTLKFNDLLTTAKKLKADALVTGHYIESKNNNNNNNRILLRPYDLNKDQSYFLFTITQKQLNYIRFPLGKLLKSEVRNIAKKYNLPVFNKPDSQDICFISNNYISFIKKLRPYAFKPGNIIHINGTILGKHNGIIHYTIGQRKGLKISFKEPLYVIRLDVNKCNVIVGPYKSLIINHLTISNINWIGDVVLKKGEVINLYIKLRSNQNLKSAKLIYNNKNSSLIILNNVENQGVSPGQACVFFENNKNNARILGGGWIQSTNYIK